VRAGIIVRAQRADTVGPRPLKLIVRCHEWTLVEISGENPVVGAFARLGAAYGGGMATSFHVWVFSAPRPGSRRPAAWSR
jgi:hypothetical protein